MCDDRAREPPLDQSGDDGPRPSADAHPPARTGSRPRRDMALPAARGPGGADRRRGLARDQGPGRLDATGHLGPAALHQRPDAVPGVGRRRCPRSSRPGVYERSFVAPAAWRGRRVVLHVGAAESVLIVRLNGDRDRAQQGLASRRGVRRHRRGHARTHERPAPDRRQVVRRDVHRGPGPVVARRHHALGVPVRRPTRSTSPTSVADRRPRGRPHDRHARPDRGRRPAPRGPRPRAGPSRRRSPGCCRRSAPRPSSTARGSWPLRPITRRHIVGGPAAVADDADA